MSTDIQQARDVLAKWREEATAAPWSTDEDWTGDVTELQAEDGNALGWLNRTGNARLIVGTAGNPEMLDALDGLLAAYATETDWRWIPSVVARIAAAIVAANERMSA